MKSGFRYSQDQHLLEKESLWEVSISVLCIKYDYKELRFILYSLFLYVFVTERIKNGGCSIRRRE